MKIVCEKEKIGRAIAVVSKAVAAKSNLSAVEGILLQAENGRLTLTGYDFELGIKTSIECRVDEGGEVILPAGLLRNIVRRAERSEISLECDARMNCKIRSGNASYNIKGMDSRDYPDFPEAGNDKNLRIENGLFTEMCDYVIYAVSTDEKRPAHTGVQIKMENDSLVMVALDGFRLAVRERKVDFSGDYSIIVPARTMREVRALRAETQGKMTITASRRYVMFTVGDYILLSRLLEGDFLDYKKAIPDRYNTFVTVKSRALADSVERAALIITERLKNPLRLEIAENVLSIKCNTEMGDVQDRLGIEQTGPDMNIAFNYRYVLDLLRAARKEELVFQFSGPLSPCKVVPKDDEDFTYLILPVRYKND